MTPATDSAEKRVIPAGQEGLVRRMVAPALPDGWAFVDARIEGDAVRARYLRAGPLQVRAELHLAHPDAADGGLATERFSVRLLAPRGTTGLAPLLAALLAAVRAAEPAFVWERPPPPAPPAYGSTRRAAERAPAPEGEPPWQPEPPPTPEGDPIWHPEPEAFADPEAFERARLHFERGDFDAALDALAVIARDSTPFDALSALTLRFERMWQIGRCHEALAALDAAIERFPESVALHGAGAARRAEMHDAERAAGHARALLELAGSSAGLTLRAATVLFSLGREDEARQAADRARAATDDDPRLRLHLADLYREVADYAVAGDLYAGLLALDPDHAGARFALATLAAWRGDWREADDHVATLLTSNPDDAAALCLRGAARVCAGDPGGALDDLDRAASLQPADPVAAVWRGAALLDLGRYAEALAETRRGGEQSDDIANHVAAQVVISLAQLRTGAFPGLPEYVLGPALTALLTDAEPVLPGAPTPPEDDLDAALSEALTRLRGNRSPVATYVRSADRRLVRLDVPPSPRVASKRALHRFVATGSLEESLAELDRVHERAPHAAEPYNYRGELHLYVGDAAAARREFERAIALYGRSRWAYIGMAGAWVLDGDFEEALRWLAEGIAQAGTPGPTAFVYRGESMRCLGRAAEARADLTLSVQRNPGRIGAWVNLGLLDVSDGDLDAARAVLATLRRRAPGFCADAALALGLDPAERSDDDDPAGLLREMLAMLRGNRASSCVTYFTRAGQLRSVPPAADP